MQDFYNPIATYNRQVILFFYFVHNFHFLLNVRKIYLFVVIVLGEELDEQFDYSLKNFMTRSNLVFFLIEEFDDGVEISDEDRHQKVSKVMIHFEALLSN